MNKGFKSFPLIKGNSKQTQYNAFLSTDSRKLLVEEISDYLTEMNLRKRNKIWLTDVGNKKATLIGKGVKPQFHLNATWISFYDPKNETLVLVNARTKETYKKIQVRSWGRPYFRPEVAMTKKLEIFYTQIDKEDKQEVIKLSKKKKVRFLKPTSVYSDFAFCAYGNRIFIKEALLSPDLKKSNISLYELQESKASRVHQDSGHYPGPLYCLPGKLFYSRRKVHSTKEAPLINELILYKLKGKKSIVEKSYNGEVSLFLNGDKLLLSHDSKVFLYNE